VNQLQKVTSELTVGQKELPWPLESTYESQPTSQLILTRMLKLKLQL